MPCACLDPLGLSITTSDDIPRTGEHEVGGHASERGDEMRSHIHVGLTNRKLLSSLLAS